MLEKLSMFFLNILVVFAMLFTSCARFHFIKDPCKMEWYIDHYYVYSDEVDEKGNPKDVTLYTRQVSLGNPLNIAKITDASIDFNKDGTFSFTDLNGKTHNGTYEVPISSGSFTDEITLNFDDGTVKQSDYFKYKLNYEKKHYLLFQYENVKYFFGIDPSFTEEEIAVEKLECIDLLKKVYSGQKLTDEDFDDARELRTWGWISDGDRYIALTQRCSHVLVTVSEDEKGMHFVEEGEIYKRYFDNQGLGYSYTFFSVDKNGNYNLMEGPALGKCVAVFGLAKDVYLYYLEQ